MYLCFHSIAFSPAGVWSNAYSLMDAASAIARIGYSGVEMTAARPHAWPPDLDGSTRRTIRKELDNLGLRVSAVCPLIAPALNPASPFPNEYKDARDHVLSCVRLAADLGSPLVVYPAGYVIRGTSSEEAWKRSCETLAAAAEVGRKEGVALAVEAIRRCSSNLLWNSDQALRMKSDVGAANVGFTMDTFHVWAEGEQPADVIRKYGNSLLHVHMEDASATGTERRVPGAGARDLPGVVRCLMEGGYEGAISVELWGLDPVETAEMSFRYLAPLVEARV
ncbi:MAG: sugar phosphate isomerase/epimerase [Firmicutes bacterium]|nr:sugar phosphate isomerase/epimerase [Bacillota bacterium]